MVVIRMSSNRQETPWEVLRNVLIAKPHITPKHIENDSCPSFDPTRPVGPHVPSHWPWLLELAKDPVTLVHHDDAHKILSTCCVLCGRNVRKAGSIITHLHSDHEGLVNQVLQRYGHRFPEFVPERKPCVCDLKTAYEGHRCHVLYQTFLLHHLTQPGQTGETLPSLHADRASPDSFVVQWQKIVQHDTLTHTCAICSYHCGHMNL